MPAALVEEALLGQVSAAAFARDDFWTAEKPSQSISAGLRTSFARTLSRTASTMGGDTRAEPIGGRAGLVVDAKTTAVSVSGFGKKGGGKGGKRAPIGAWEGKGEVEQVDENCENSTPNVIVE